MKEDYLWDKTGADPAIEKLENALSAFSYSESSLQMPVRTVTPVANRRAFRFWSFGFATAAACVAIAAISWALWGRIADQNGGPPVQAGAVVPETAAPSVTGPEVNGPGIPLVAERKTPAGVAERRKKPVKRLYKSAAITARVKEKKPEADNLTKEEIYAYNRLMLALSITSDKLNLVKEKVGGE